jgi:hypothetical protein
LRGRQDFVAALERQAELHDFEGFARVAGDGHLFGIAAEARSQPAPHGLDFGLDPSPHRDRRGLIGDREVALECLLHDPGAGRDAAVVQVDEPAVDVERLLDRLPVVFVLRDLFGRSSEHRAVRTDDSRQCVVLQGRDRRGSDDQGAEKAASRGHGYLIRQNPLPGQGRTGGLQTSRRLG